jgi:hypothetical protein
MLRLRPQNWDQVLSDYRLGWAESNRRACLDNLGPLSNAARVHAAGGKARATGNRVDDSSQAAPEVHRLADRLYGAHFFCPEGGHYLLSPDGRSVTCSVHGSSLSPRQPSAPSDDGRTGQLLRSFSGLTASLTFREDGLRAVVVVERTKP